MYSFSDSEESPRNGDENSTLLMLGLSDKRIYGKVPVFYQLSHDFICFPPTKKATNLIGVVINYRKMLKALAS